MTKKQLSKILIITIIVTILFDIFLGRYVVAKVSTLPILNRLKILSPQAPIVINNRETIRVADSGDAVSATNSVKSRISTIVQVSNKGALNVTGSALNLTTDGTFLTATKSFLSNDNNYFVILNDGRSAKITSRIVDPATDLVFFKADISNIAVANFGNSKDLNVGEKVLFLNNSVQSYLTKSFLTFINSSEKDLQGQVFLSDYPNASFGVSVNSELLSGQSVVSTNGDIVGMWNGSKIISATNLQQAILMFYSSSQKIARPSFGFSYKIITENESKITGTKVGAQVIEVTGTNSKQAGLVAGDIILKVNDTAVNEQDTLEDVLQKYKPADKITFTIFRNNLTSQINLVVSELK